VEELETWLKGFIFYTEKKIEHMKTSFPTHRNIGRFEGEVNMAKKVLNKINATNTKNRE